MNKMEKTEILRGDIFLVDFGSTPKENSVQAGKRPAVVVQNNAGNRHASVVIVVPLTSKKKKFLPTHVKIDGYGLHMPSTIICEQILTVGKSCLEQKIGHIPPDIEAAVNRALAIELDLTIGKQQKRNTVWPSIRDMLYKVRSWFGCLGSEADKDKKADDNC